MSEPALGAEATAERNFHKVLWVASVLSLIALICCVFVVFHADNEFSPPESVVAAQSLMLAHNGTLYYDLKHYPLTVCAYTPLFYLLETGLIRIGLPAVQAGRLISIAAWCGIVLLSFKLVLLYTSDRTAAWVCAILVSSSPLLLYWGTTGQVDTLAVFFALFAFLQFSRFQVNGEPKLLYAALFALLALFTKQTMVAVPATICLTLLLRDKKRALLFGALFGATIVIAIIIVDKALDGRFLSNTVLANMNPMVWRKLFSQLRYFGAVSGCLALVAAMCFGRLLRSRSVAVCVYLVCVALVFLATAPKVGSDTNYQMELTVVLAIGAAIGLHELGFFPLLFQGSKKWMTLLLLPIAVHTIVGYRATANVLVLRWVMEAQWRSLEDKLRPYVQPVGGLVLSGDYNSMVRLRQRLDIEPLIYSLLVTAHRIDPEPVRRDLERGAFSTVLLGENVFGPKPAFDAEIGTLPEEQLEAIRKHYRLEKHVDSPFEGGVYIYKPLSGVSQ